MQTKTAPCPRIPRRYRAASFGGDCRGISTAELLLTVAIIAVIAGVAVPSLAPARSQELNLAVTTVAEALHFARDQAGFTGVAHGVVFDTDQQTLRLFRLDTAVAPPAPTYDVLHPVSRQAYTVRFAQRPFESVTLHAVRRSDVSGCGTATEVLFDELGVVRCLADASFPASKIQIELSLDGVLSRLALDPATGRVSF